MRVQPSTLLATVILVVFGVAYLLGMFDAEEAPGPTVGTQSEASRSTDEVNTLKPIEEPLSPAEAKLTSSAFREPEAKSGRSSHSPAVGALHIMVKRRKDGTPVVDREGLLVLLGESNFWPPSIRSRSDGSGLMKFENLKPGQVELRVPWHASVDWTVKRGEVVKKTLFIDALPVIAGRVVDKQGVGVAGARIVVQLRHNYEDADHVVARTGPSGHFELRDSEVKLPVSLMATHSDFAPSSRLSIANEEEATLDQILSLSEQGGRFVAVVRDEQENAIAGARVFIATGHKPVAPKGDRRRRHSHRGLIAITDKEGRCVLSGVPLGVHQVRVVAQGFSPLTAFQSIEPDIVNGAALRMQASCTIQGKVLKPDGSLARTPHVRFRIQSGGDHYSSGSYAAEFCRSDLPTGSTVIEATVSSGERAELELTTHPGSVNDVVLKLKPSPQIKGVLVDASGSPQEGWMIQASEEGDLSASHLAGRSNHLGEFVLKGCSAASYFLRITSPEPPQSIRYGINQVLVERTGLSPGGDPVRIVVPSVAKPSSWISGRIRGPDGELLKGMSCRLTSSGRANNSASIPVDQETGEFRMGPLIEGMWSVELRAHGFAPAGRAIRDLRGGEARDLGDIKLHVGGQVEFVFTGATELLRGFGSYVGLVNLEAGLGESIKVVGKSVTSPSVNPGRYAYQFTSLLALAVAGELEIQTGRVAKVVIPIEAGVMQVIEVTDLPANLKPGQLHLSIQELKRPEVSVWNSPARVIRDPLRLRVVLSPSKAYTVTLLDAQTGRKSTRTVTASAKASAVHSLSMKH